MTEKKEELQFISCMCQVSIGDIVRNEKTREQVKISSIEDETILAQKRASGERWYLVK